MSPTAAPSSVHLRPLLAACVSASALGGRVLREVVERHVALDLVSKQDGTYDPQTVADRRSQQRIVHALRHSFPHVTIVGEEGELGPPRPEDQLQCDLCALDDVAFSSSCKGAEGLSSGEVNGPLDWTELVLWVDPLDGTKRFAAGLHDEVSVLIGISYRQRPLAGVVHLPFKGTHGVTYWGGPSVGVFCSTYEDSSAQTLTHVKLSKETMMYPKRQLICTVSSTTCDQADKALQLLGPETVRTGGATGTMVLSVVTGASDAFFRFKAATRKWDICAVEPLLEGLGGKLTDTQGNAYTYDHIGNAPEFDNERGLLASLEPAVHQMLLDAYANVSLLSALDGREMAPQWFQECVFVGRQVVSVNLVPASAHYGKQSAVATLDVHFNDRDKRRTTRVFLKKAVKNELPPRTAAQWTRDIASYRAEATFYARYAPLLQQRGVSLIRPLAVFQSDAAGTCTTNLVAKDTTIPECQAHCSAPINFMLLLECLGSAPPASSSLDDLQSLATYEAADRLELVDTKQALRYLAHLHASTWGLHALDDIKGGEPMAEACWWMLSKRGETEVARALHIWPQMLRNWESVFESETELPSLAELTSLGERMVQEAAYVNACLTVHAAASVRTFVHGDFKSANLFFESQSRDVVAFDWQWSGMGLGAMDVATLLNTSVSISVLSTGTDEHELQLLQFYYTCLRERLQALDPSVHLDQRYPFEAFERHYMLATLEYARVLISNFWHRLTPSTCAAKGSRVNCGLGYRSVPHVVRLVRKLHQNLRRLETERLQVAS
ncbi:unnamed protein product [Hyaloperonospora brassicae]|uniref:3'(2'),5'-bisphosphate nucleotidase 1 n=1 Tax=Hyaloperonospora brassicae TaxID=162125 RepID=A0AAV0UX04_HYABA|nr:unnamed protein product [Hyaloperonospora brassicae]